MAGEVFDFILRFCFLWKVENQSPILGNFYQKFSGQTPLLFGGARGGIRTHNNCLLNSALPDELPSHQDWRAPLREETSLGSSSPHMARIRF